MCNNFPSCFSFQQETCSGSGKWAPRWIIPALITTLNTKGFYRPDTGDFNFPETSHWSLPFLTDFSTPIHSISFGPSSPWVPWRKMLKLKELLWMDWFTSQWMELVPTSVPIGSQHDMGIVICRQHNWVNFWWRVSFHGSVGKSLAVERCMFKDMPNFSMTLWS
jgi:hypothetical protein